MRRLLLPLVTAALLLVATASASAASLDAPWAGGGSGTTTVVSNGTAGDPEFRYSQNAFSGSWSFTAVAGSARSLPVNWSYNGFHSFFQVRVSLVRFIRRNNVEILTQTLVNAGPANCCSSPSNGFSYGGTSTFDLQPGDQYGFRMTGSHNDGTNFLGGTLTLWGDDATPPSVAPVVTGTTGQHDFYTSDVGVTWTVSDPDSPLSSSTGCEAATVTEDTAGRTFTCTAVSRGGTTTESVTIKRDTTPPAVTVPESRTEEATGPAGALVSYAASATDALDGAPELSCSPASGSQFAIGDTTVTCTATDAAGNSATGTFTVHVRGSAEQLANLAGAVDASSLGSTTATSIVKLLDDVQGALASGSTTSACGKLGAVTNKIRAKSGKDVTGAEASALIAQVTRIADVAGCR